MKRFLILFNLFSLNVRVIISGLIDIRGSRAVITARTHGKRYKQDKYYSFHVR